MLKNKNLKFVRGLKMNVVIVRHETSTVKYTLLVPKTKSLKAGDLVKVSTKHGNALAICLCDSFVVDMSDTDKAKSIFTAFGVNEPTAYVVGKFNYDEWK